jgi:acyl-CoA thioesterase FadM
MRNATDVYADSAYMNLYPSGARIAGRYEVAGRLVAEGCSTQVWYDYAAGESRAVPGEVVEGRE